MSNIGARGRYLTGTVAVTQGNPAASVVHTVTSVKRWLFGFINIKVTTSGAENTNTVKFYTDDGSKAVTSKFWPDETNIPNTFYGIDLLRFFGRSLEAQTEINVELTNGNAGGGGTLTLTLDVYIIEGDQ